MREVRMTFGEHLEELRWRIIVSLCYLAVGVTIAFIYGEDLMRIALVPHQRAFSVAQRNRVISRMESQLDDLLPLTGMSLHEARVKGKPLVGDEVHWEVLFPAEVVRARLDFQFQAPFRALSQDLRRDLLPSLPREEREDFAERLDALGSKLSHLWIAELATAFDLNRAADIPRRFQRLAARLRALEAEETAAQMKQMIGWGKDFSGLLGRLDLFNSFLDKRRQEASQSSASLQDLRAWASPSPLADGLDDALLELEESLEKIQGGVSSRITVISYLESFSSYLKLAVIFGLMLSIPFILYEMWKFVGAGLYLQEQRYVVTFLPFSLGLFVSGGLFGYFLLIPVGLRFLAGWGTDDVEMSFTLGNYIGLFITLTLILGLVFQTPLVMVFLSKLGIVRVAAFRRARRIAIFGGVCLAVVLTPPDPFSWSLMAAPMILLYELGIIVCQFLEREKKAEALA
jgi:sec-independent protein translocase protein TatC